MSRYRITAGAAVFLILIVALFEVHLDPVVSLPRTVERPDRDQAARYEQCVAELTNEATRRALEAADNPDVQSLMIRMRQKDAIEECRDRFPERYVTVEEPLRINLIDLKWRF